MSHFSLCHKLRSLQIGFAISLCLRVSLHFRQPRTPHGRRIYSYFCAPYSERAEVYKQRAILPFSFSCFHHSKLRICLLHSSFFFLSLKSETRGQEKSILLLLRTLGTTLTLLNPFIYPKPSHSAFFLFLSNGIRNSRRSRSRISDPGPITANCAGPDSYPRAIERRKICTGAAQGRSRYRCN